MKNKLKKTEKYSISFVLIITLFSILVVPNLPMRCIKSNFAHGTSYNLTSFLNKDRAFVQITWRDDYSRTKYDATCVSQTCTGMRITKIFMHIILNRNQIRRFTGELSWKNQSLVQFMTHFFQMYGAGRKKATDFFFPFTRRK